MRSGLSLKESTCHDPHDEDPHDTAPHDEEHCCQKGAGLLDPAMLAKSLPEAIRKVDPRTLWRNPVMFIVEIGAIWSTVLAIMSPSWFGWLIVFWLWLTVIFANLAEAVAEGRGKAQAETLRKTKADTMARRLKGWQPGSAGWQGSTHVFGGYTAPGGTIAAASRRTGYLDVFVVGVDGLVYTTGFDPKARSWKVWQLLRGPRVRVGTRTIRDRGVGRSPRSCAAREPVAPLRHARRPRGVEGDCPRRIRPR